MYAATKISDESLLKAAAKLPASPAILAEFNELTLDPHMVLDEVTALLRRDSTLAAGVVRVSNSPVYGGDRISAVEDAVARVGLKEIYRLVSLATTARLSEMALPVYGVFVGKLARGTLYHGLAAEKLAMACGFDRRVAYTASLVRTLGMRVVDWILRDADWVAPASSSDMLGWERDTFGRTSPEVAHLILRDWRFGEDVLDAVIGQYAVGDLDEVSPMAVLVNLAGHFTAQAECSIAGEQHYWEPTPEKLAVVGLQADAMGDLAQDIEREFERTMDILN